MMRCVVMDLGVRAWAGLDRAAMHQGRGEEIRGYIAAHDGCQSTASLHSQPASSQEGARISDVRRGKKDGEPGGNCDERAWHAAADLVTHRTTQFSRTPSGLPRGLMARLGWGLAGKMAGKLANIAADAPAAVECVSSQGLSTPEAGDQAGT
ncbi:hypothetical protein GGTG_02861 [Gaeumannomyces tritici R3-111a-1]|uniref:Uncharacterized protein n=1 Tax=Gaeumannomyces tritici (strain R3-111a-1) TaxID=644352 RepID=J3NNK4_GAET3|nr:hypothetical protein GGTG_02861 [Gaeumannomyces tritici R3-111a-1]EJT77756.1 hypothetical protein GGTG_02861 [Gaeumannomyces tritici R3-111a-1]